MTRRSSNRRSSSDGPVQAAVPNATALHNLTPWNFVENLRLRYEDAFTDKNKAAGIYTWVGTVLVAVNPYKSLNCYGPEYVDHHFRKTIAHADPHPFGTAAHAYCSLQKTKMNQSIIISGESGAGKTETSKIVLEFLTNVGNQSCLYDASKILQTSPILEAFGNAKTLRNENSSRFGKTVRLFFDCETGKSLVGANIETYLLARSRVTHTPAGERNYHIFYLLTNGLPADDPLRAALGLVNLESRNFQYLRKDNNQSAHIPDDSFLKQVRQAFRVLGVDCKEEENLYKRVAAVLWLGNIDIVCDPRNEAGASRIGGSRVPLDFSAQFLGIKSDENKTPSEVLELWLTKQRLSAGRRGEVTWGDMSVGKAKAFRDSLAKTLYDRIFQDLVGILNRALGAGEGGETPIRRNLRSPDFFATPKKDFSNFSPPPPTPEGGYPVSRGTRNRRGGRSPSPPPMSVTAPVLPCMPTPPGHACRIDDRPSISILDIFGFESFPSNGLEQLCINYANEKIHRFFLENVILSEIDEYSREAVTYRPVEPTDNRGVVAAIEGVVDFLRKTTIDSMMRPLEGVDYDGEFVDKLNNSAHLTVKRATRAIARGFDVRHFAGEVCYSAEGFIDANKDSETRLDALIGLCDADDNGPSSYVFDTPSSRFSVAESTNGSIAPIQTRRCIASTFVKQVGTLLNELSRTRGHYIKCIKPNDKKIPRDFDFQRVREQLRVGGMFEVLDLMAHAFPVRIPYMEIYSRYQSLLGETTLKALGRGGGSLAKIFTEELLGIMQSGYPLSFLSDKDGDVNMDGISCLKAADFALGTSKVFFLLGKVEPLENLLQSCDSDPKLAAQVADAITLRLSKKRRARQILFVRQATRFVIILRKRRNLKKWFYQYFMRLAFLAGVFRRVWYPKILARRKNRENAANVIQSKWRKWIENKKRQSLRQIISCAKSFLCVSKLRFVLPQQSEAARNAQEKIRENDENCSMFAQDRLAGWYRDHQAKEITTRAQEDEISRLQNVVKSLVNEVIKLQGVLSEKGDELSAVFEQRDDWRKLAEGLRSETEGWRIKYETEKDKNLIEIDRLKNAMEGMQVSHKMDIEEKIKIFMHENEITKNKNKIFIDEIENNWSTKFADFNKEKDEIERDNKRLKSNISEIEIAHRDEVKSLQETVSLFFIFYFFQLISLLLKLKMLKSKTQQLLNK